MKIYSLNYLSNILNKTYKLSFKLNEIINFLKKTKLKNINKIFNKCMKRK